MADTVLVDHWRPRFRHSAGRLGSAFLDAARQERKLLGWKTGNPARVIVPPKDLGTDGEWVPIGPGARLLGVVPAAWSAGSGEAALADHLLGRVLPDGADTPFFALVGRGHDGAEPAPGARLSVRFRAGGGEGPWEFWFVPEVEGNGR